LAGATFAQEPNWSVQMASNDDANSPRCFLKTPDIVIDDEQGETTMSLRVDNERMIVITDSNIDAGFGDLTIEVDGKGTIPADSVLSGKNVLFESQIIKILEQFAAGRRVAVRLRFWPTWPTTGVKTAHFSLIGFTKAEARLTDCG